MSNIQPTSIWSWQNVHASLYRKKRRAMAYAHLAMHGPMTSGEMTMAFPPEGNPSWHRRLEELEKMQLVRRIGERKCKYSQQIVCVWEIIIGASPVNIVQGQTRMERLLAIVRAWPTKEYAGSEISEEVAQIWKALKAADRRERESRGVYDKEGSDRDGGAGVV